MNLNGDEKRIRQLYRELAADDQRQAPAYARVLARAESRADSSRESRWTLKLAFALASLCLAVAVAVFVFSRSKQLEPAPENQAVTDKQDPPAVVTPDSREANPGSVVYPVRKVRHRRQQHSTTLALRSLFAWKSPTASLMNLPEDKLLNSLPRLGESLQTIKLISPDEFN